jgi:hypothetical protein
LFFGINLSSHEIHVFWKGPMLHCFNVETHYTSLKWFLNLTFSIPGYIHWLAKEEGTSTLKNAEMNRVINSVCYNARRKTKAQKEKEKKR